jgi:hypothetical protein
MGNCLNSKEERKSKYDECKKCRLKYRINIRTCPHHRFRKKGNVYKCIDCKLYKNKYGGSQCYHQE